MLCVTARLFVPFFFFCFQLLMYFCFVFHVEGGGINYAASVIEESVGDILPNPPVCLVLSGWREQERNKESGVNRQVVFWGGGGRRQRERSALSNLDI